MGFNVRNYVEAEIKRNMVKRRKDKHIELFHKMANACGRKNLLAKFQVNGAWLLEEAKLKDGVSISLVSLLAHWYTSCVP